MSTTTRSTAAVLALLTLAPVAGCGKKSPTQPKTVAGPTTPAVATTPDGTVQNLLWGMTHINAPTYDALFTNDFTFVFSPFDGNYPSALLNRDQELVVADHMLGSGGGTTPKATKVTITTGPITVNPDSRPGRDPATHKEVLLSFALAVEAGDQQWSTQGTTRFFIVRGDAATVDHPDAARWWIERWEDDTNPPPVLASGLEPTPTQFIYWGDIKAKYLSGPPSLTR